MIAIPARVSPVPSMPHALPGSPVRSAAPAVVIRQAVEPAAATPAVTLHSAGPTPRHSPPHSYPAYYSPPRTVVATPAAVVHDYHLAHAPHAHDHHHAHHHGSRTIQPQHAAAVAAHTVESNVHHYAYCDHHAPVVYAQPAVTASPRHSPPQVVYQPPSPTTAHYQLVYQPAPTHYYHASMYGVAVPQPSLSPPHKPLLHRPTAMAPPLSLSTGVGSAFTPVQPIAMYPRTGILIQ